MKLSCPFTQPRRRAFTLVELMTAIVVLSLMVLLFSQIISLTSQSTSASFRRADAFGEARMALDRFGIDWDARARRSDLAPSFTNAANTAAYCDTATFYSQVNGFGTGPRTISQIGYYVASSANALQRADSSTTWTGASTSPLFSATPVLPTVNYQTLADGICRIQFYFQLASTGQLMNAPPPGFTNVGAVVVAVAVLDKVTRKQVSTAQITALSAALGDATTPGTTPETQWNANLQAASGTLPAPIAQNVRIYQRTFYAN